MPQPVLSARGNKNRPNEAAANAEPRSDVFEDDQLLDRLIRRLTNDRECLRDAKEAKKKLEEALARAQLCVERFQQQVHETEAEVDAELLELKRRCRRTTTNTAKPSLSASPSLRRRARGQNEDIADSDEDEAGVASEPAGSTALDDSDENRSFGLTGSAPESADAVSVRPRRAPAASSAPADALASVAPAAAKHPDSDIGPRWLERFEELREYMAMDGGALQLPSKKERYALYNFARNQRAAYQRKQIAAEKIRLLDAIGFKWRGRKKPRKTSRQRAQLATHRTENKCAHPILCKKKESQSCEDLHTSNQPGAIIRTFGVTRVSL